MKRSLLLITLSLLLVSGNSFAIQQAIYGLGGFLFSIVKTPYDLVDKSSSIIKYNKLVKKAETEKEQLLSLEKGEVKLCSKWQDESEDCSCEDVCPMDLSLLELNKQQYLPTAKNSLVYRNHDYFYPFGDGFGHCWGHASMTQRLTRLAIFAPEQNMDSASSKEWKRFYKKIIRDLSNNKARIVPGFANILEFSSHPVIKEQFRKRLSLLWFKNAMTVSGLIQTGTGHYTNSGRLRYVKHVQERLARNQTPLVVANSPIPIVGTFFNSHAIIAWKSYTDDYGNNVICYRDNNLQPETADDKSNSDCFAKDIISPEGEILQHWWKKNKSIAYHEDSDTYKHVKSLNKLCKKLHCNSSN